MNNQLHFRAGGLQNATCFAYCLAILGGKNEAQPYFEGSVLAEGCGNVPSMAAEAHAGASQQPAGLWEVQ